MKIAVISDIHGNDDAFVSVLADIDARGIDTIVSLGDNIGYGAEPERVFERLREREIPSVLGNHEQGIVLPQTLAWFNPLARRSLQQTATWLSDETVAAIHRFPVSLHRDDCWFVHGFPPDSPSMYLFQADSKTIRRAIEALPSRLCFVGHTHELELVAVKKRQTVREPLHPGTRKLNRRFRYLINVGSVGQPRDGSPQAKYVIFDPETWAVEVCAVPYDTAAAAGKIIAAGLPESHARRLG